LILVVLISMAVVVFLQSRDVSSKLDAVAVISSELREEGVESANFDRSRALEVISILDGLISDPESISHHTDDLKTIAATAASWAAGASSPSVELHASVAIRTAAGELRAYGIRPHRRHLNTAKRELAEARDILTTTHSTRESAPSGLVTDGVKDRLHNLENSQRERIQELEEELGP
jgi:hypothetical protein